jgi:hypothetical protein
MMKQVKSFKILSHTIKVSYLKRVFCPEKGELMGDCDPDTLRLKVRNMGVDGDAVPPSAIEHNRWHEQVHLMFKFAGRDELYEDEILVDTIAGYLAQYESSKK